MMLTQSSLLYASFTLYLLSVALYLLHWITRHRLLWRSAFVLVLVGFIIQSILLGIRWYSAGYLPVTNLFSTQFFFSWTLAATYLYFELRYRIHAAGLFVMFCNLLLLGSALPRDLSLPPLIPALDTPLFTLHVAFSFTGYAFFAMAFSMGVLYLLQKRLQSELLPDLALLRKLNEESVFLGFSSVYTLYDFRMYLGLCCLGLLFLLGHQRCLVFSCLAFLCRHVPREIYSSLAG